MKITKTVRAGIAASVLGAGAARGGDLLDFSANLDTWDLISGATLGSGYWMDKSSEVSRHDQVQTLNSLIADKATTAADRARYQEIINQSKVTGMSPRQIIEKPPLVPGFDANPVKRVQPVLPADGGGKVTGGTATPIAGFDANPVKRIQPTLPNSPEAIRAGVVLKESVVLDAGQRQMVEQKMAETTRQQAQQRVIEKLQTPAAVQAIQAIGAPAGAKQAAGFQGANSLDEGEQEVAAAFVGAAAGVNLITDGVKLSAPDEKRFNDFIQKSGAGQPAKQAAAGDAKSFDGAGAGTASDKTGASAQQPVKSPDNAQVGKGVADASAVKSAANPQTPVKSLDNAQTGKGVDTAQQGKGVADAGKSVTNPQQPVKSAATAQQGKGGGAGSMSQNEQNEAAAALLSPGYAVALDQSAQKQQAEDDRDRQRSKALLDAMIKPGNVPGQASAAGTSIPKPGTTGPSAATPDAGVSAGGDAAAPLPGTGKKVSVDAPLSPVLAAVKTGNVGDPAASEQVSASPDKGKGGGSGSGWLVNSLTGIGKAANEATGGALSQIGDGLKDAGKTAWKAVPKDIRKSIKDQVGTAVGTAVADNALAGFDEANRKQQLHDLQKAIDAEADPDHKARLERLRDIAKQSGLSPGQVMDKLKKGEPIPGVSSSGGSSDSSGGATTGSSSSPSGGGSATNTASTPPKGPSPAVQTLQGIESNLLGGAVTHTNAIQQAIDEADKDKPPATTPTPPPDEPKPTGPYVPPSPWTDAGLNRDRWVSQNWIDSIQTQIDNLRNTPGSRGNTDIQNQINKLQEEQDGWRQRIKDDDAALAQNAASRNSQSADGSGEGSTLPPGVNPSYSPGNFKMPTDDEIAALTGLTAPYGTPGYNPNDDTGDVKPGSNVDTGAAGGMAQGAQNTGAGSSGQSGSGSGGVAVNTGALGGDQVGDRNRTRDGHGLLPGTHQTGPGGSMGTGQVTDPFAAGAAAAGQAAGAAAGARGAVDGIRGIGTLIGGKPPGGHGNGNGNGNGGPGGTGGATGGGVGPGGVGGKPPGGATGSGGGSGGSGGGSGGGTGPGGMGGGTNSAGGGMGGTGGGTNGGGGTVTVTGSGTAGSGGPTAPGGGTSGATSSGSGGYAAGPQDRVIDGSASLAGRVVTGVKVTVNCDAYGIPDSFQILYNGATIGSSPMGSGARVMTGSAAGNSPQVTIRVISGSDQGTMWNWNAKVEFSVQ